MQVSGQLQALAALNPEKVPSVPLNGGGGVLQPLYVSYLKEINFRTNDLFHIACFIKRVTLHGYFVSNQIKAEHV